MDSLTKNVTHFVTLMVLLTSFSSSIADSPTYPPEHSEHFKPCRDKDLAYCLNDGDCFVIETLTGSHKHCRCKDGYQGVRCDQFLPKTDSILSDPSKLKFLNSEEVYQRQVLSITCITIGITILGSLCVAFYCRNNLLNMQANLSIPFASENGGHKTELKCSRLNHVAVGQANEGPLVPSSAPPTLRACSIPIIPSVLEHDDTSCMQTHIKGGRSSSSDCLPQVENSTSAVSGLGQQEEVALLLETAQEQLRLLAQAQRKSEDCIPPPSAERESTCFLLPPGGGVATKSDSLVHPSEMFQLLSACCLD
uniref:Pro-neuregulin-3, membrane-bound isoform n=1 Tax=Erpetoichthys calabaricus TaxID=27687 RepID=A0A8C4S7U1_ERPCA